MTSTLPYRNSAIPAESSDKREAPKITRTVDLRGPGYMPLAGAGVWIATKGLQIDVDPNDEFATAALRKMLDHIASGNIRVV